MSQQPAHKGHVEPTATINRDPQHPPLAAREKIPNNPALITIKGLSRKPLRDIYPYLLATSWPRLLTMISAAYLAANALFGGLFWLDPGGIENVRAGNYWDAF